MMRILLPLVFFLPLFLDSCKDETDNGPLPELDTSQKVVKVLVLNYDPIVKFQGTAEGTRLHSFYSWGDPHQLTEEYIHDVLVNSNNLVKYNVVEWKDIDGYPKKKDGFTYDDASYLECIYGGDRSKCHMPDELDYVGMVNDNGVVEGINQDKYDEVWIFGAPYFGFWEAAMAGPGAFNINGGIYPEVPAKKAFAIMGFNYERGVAEMLHDLSHRTETTMSKVYGGWAADQLTTSWAQFAANTKQSGAAAVGSCHYPPNAESDYDYQNSRKVSSSADDWLNYPMLSGKKTMIDAEAWGGPDYQRNYLNWWFNHLPRRVGVAPDGKLNNWWRYVFEYNENVIGK